MAEPSDGRGEDGRPPGRNGGPSPAPITPVILAGGSGTRLWPLSRTRLPKPFLPLAGGRSMLEATAARVAGAPFSAAIVVCAEEHRFPVTDRLGTPAGGGGAEAGPLAIILEPVARNTAAATALAAHWLEDAGGDGLMLVMPADHLIVDAEAFRAAVLEAVPAAAGGRIVTFGIKPERPDTGYGYIKAGAALPGPGAVRAIAAFVEKPDRAAAAALIAGGDHFWNSGIFLMSAATYLAELEALAPGIAAASRAAFQGAETTTPFIRAEGESLARAPAVSIDRAVMERTNRGAVLPADFGWSDLGTWSALQALGPRDAAGNVTEGDVALAGVRNAYVRADARLIAVAGIDDVVVVETDDAVLVAGRDAADDVKALVERLAGAGRPEVDAPAVEQRPWGWFRSLRRGPGFHVKEIVVTPGGRLSLQRHRHRAEHWVVVEGTARVTCGEDTFLLGRNEAANIPLGAVHRIENAGDGPVRLIEVQCGDYLGEDDIVRLDDQYGRAGPGGRAADRSGD